MAEQHEPLNALGVTVMKWALGAAWMCIVAAFTWMWATDRAVRGLIQSTKEYREQREKDELLQRHEREQKEQKEQDERREFRDKITASIERLGQRVGPLELEQARQQGREEAQRQGPR